ncbi:MAG: DNA primase small subunit domain-containing protein [Candidatus Thorarchaeota archaeon]
MSDDNQGKTTTIMKLRLLFHKYYSENPNSVDVPQQIHTREFAIQWWEQNWRCRKQGSKVDTGCGKSGKSFKPITECPSCGSKAVNVTNWTRHAGYKSKEDLLRNLTKIAPHSVYHSAAFYGFPTAISMSEKEWNGAELVFDIDADHLDLTCANDHDAWQCKNPGCKKTGKGKPPEICPICGDAWYCNNLDCNEQGDGDLPKACPKCGSKTSRKLFGFHTRKWICEKCLNVAKDHTLKLYDEFLVDDFGFDPDKIQINYSGHRGYHIRVHDPNVYKLDSNARMEIVQYVMGLGFRGDKGIISQGGSSLIPSRDIPGWSGKLADAIVEFIQNIDTYTGRERWVTALKDKEKKIIALKMLHRPRPVLGGKVKGIGIKSWQEIAEKAVERFGSEIDRPVTHDIHRVIRLIGSLNGKTGFAVTELTRDSIDKFNPFNDAVVFNEGTLNVRFHKGPAPAFTINDEKYGPFSGGSAELPTAAAVFLLGKEVALLE